MSRRAWALFATLSLVWGIPYLLIKVSVEEMSPASVVLLRCAVGAAVLLPLVVARGRLRSVARHWRAVLLFTVLEMTVPWYLLAWAEQDLSSSLTGVLVALVPIAAALAGLLAGEADRPDRVRVLGMVLGVAGVAALLGLDVGGGQLWAVAAVGVVVVGYATAPLVVSRALSDTPTDAVSAVALVLTALVYAPLAVPSLAIGPLPSVDALASVVVLGLVCTAGGLLAFFALIREAGPHRALVITFVNPVVATVLGVWLLGEPVTAGLLLGLPVIVVGCALATRSTREAPQPVAQPGVDLVPEPEPEPV